MIVYVVVIPTVIVAALGNGNDTVAVTDTVDGIPVDTERAKHGHARLLVELVDEMKHRHPKRT